MKNVIMSETNYKHSYLQTNNWLEIAATLAITLHDNLMYDIFKIFNSLSSFLFFLILLNL